MKEKVIVVTGASAGIGAATAEHLARAGASLSLVARRPDALQEVRARCGERGHAIVADVTRREDVRRVVTESIARFGGVDVWINNAGRGITRLPSELTDEDVDDMMNVNVKSALYGMQEILPHFKSRGAGHIINISSMLGRLPYVLQRSAYTGSKHFVNALTANFRMELQEAYPGIQISIVSPGVVRTEFGVHARHGGVDSRQIPESQSADEVAAVVVDVIRTRRPDVYTRAGSRDRILAYYTSLGEDP